MVKADSNGVLPRIGQSPDSSWQPIIDDLSSQFPALIRDPNISVIARGSAARGASVEEVADLDLVVLLKEPVELPKVIRSKLKPELKVETSVIPLQAFERWEDWAGMRFMLAHNGYTIFGPDKLIDLPDPVLGPHSFVHLRNADKWLSRWQTFWAQDKDRLAICEWLMKRIIRSLFESQMMKLNAYSRDIYPCAQIAMKAFPDHEHVIRRAAELAVEPSVRHSIVEDVTEQLSKILRTEQEGCKRKNSKS